VFNYVLINNKKPDSKRLKKYKEEEAEFVRIVLSKEQKKSYQIIEEDLLRTRGLLRHDLKKLKNVLEKILL
jgi:2-phospho-L-lactate transferase/gluconeogenesis factor (CofD/UPF0052 family)